MAYHTAFRTSFLPQTYNTQTDKNSHRALFTLPKGKISIYSGWFVQPLSSVGEAVFTKRLASLARIGGQRNR